MSGDWLDLADAVGLLRDQLVEAQQRGQHSDLRFGLGEITLELAVELSRSHGADGGLRFGIATAGVRGERSSRSTHRVVVALTPKLTGGRDVEISDEDN
jgi:hypothetical protein